MKKNHQEKENNKNKGLFFVLFLLMLVMFLSGMMFYVDEQITLINNTNSTSSNITDNFTGNQIYGEMWNYTSGGWLFDIDDAGVYYNLTGFTEGFNNGFVFVNNDTLNGGSRFEALVDGIYKVDLSLTFNSIANGGLFGVSLNHDYNPDTHRNCYARREASTDTANLGITCVMDLMAGESVGVMIENENTNRDINIYAMNLNTLRIGNIV